MKQTMLALFMFALAACAGAPERLDDAIEDLVTEVNKAVAAGYLDAERGAQLVKDANDNAARIKDLLAQVAALRATYESSRN